MTAVLNAVAQRGDVLNILANEFTQHAAARVVGEWAAPERRLQLCADGLMFCIRAHPIKQFLGRTVETDFECLLQAAAPGAAEIHLTHTGSLRRTGLSGRVKHGATAQAILQTVLADAAFVAAALPLDFKRFALVQDARGWHAQVSLLGGAWLSHSFPPVQRYVPLGKDQVQALVGSLKRLVEVFIN